MRTLTLALTLFCAALYGADTKNIDRTLPLHASGSVRLEAHNGTIHVHTWDRPEIEIHVRIEAGGTSAQEIRRFNETTVEITGSADAVTIKTREPDFSWNWGWLGGNNAPQVHYTITSPRTARWNVEDHNSRAELRDVAGDVHFTMHNGDLRLTNFNGGLDLSMHNGTTHVEFAQFSHSSTVDMHNGSVDMTMPANSRFDLRTEGHNMSIDSDFATLVRSSSYRHNRSDLSGPVNGGGPSLRISSHNGHVRLHAR